MGKNKTDPTLFKMPEQQMCTKNEDTKHMKNLERRVFIYGKESQADKIYFKNRIMNWCKEPEYTISLSDLCWQITWERNDEGKTIKYLYFNESSQKLSLDKYFFEWVKLIKEDIENALVSS